MQTSFGAGVLIAQAAGSNTTPRKFGAAQEVSFDLTWSMKELYGQKEFPIDLGRGTGKMNGKVKSATISGALFGEIICQPTSAPTTTQTIGVSDERKTPAGGPPPTATAANTTGFVDEGCIDVTTGVQMKLVTSSPAVGASYMVNNSTGVYTFATGQGDVLISYRYTTSGTVASNFSYDNKDLGTAPTFGVVFQNLRNAKGLLLRARSCVASKVSFQSKLDDFMIPEFDFGCFADTTGFLFDWASAE